MLLQPFNLAMVIVSALLLLILLGLVGMAAEALNPTANKPSETTVEVRDAAITAPAEEAIPAPKLNRHQTSLPNKHLKGKGISPPRAAVVVFLRDAHQLPRLNHFSICRAK